MKEAKNIKGIWMPEEILHDPKLNHIEKFVLVEIMFFDKQEHGCFASNATLAQLCHCSERKVSGSIAKLKRLGYISVESGDCKNRSITVNIERFASLTSQSVQGNLANRAWIPSKVCEVTSHDVRQNKLYNKLENKLENNKRNSLKKAAAEDGIKKIVDMYNGICISLPRVSSVSEARKRAITARSRDHTEEQMRHVFEKAEASDFLKGKNKRGWRADFDWLMRDANFSKVLDGNYDDRFSGDVGSAGKDDGFCHAEYDDGLAGLFGD